MPESIHEKLKRVRKPRVHLTYEVYTGGAKVKKDLPFVVGVMGDFCGNNASGDVKALKDRNFIQIDRDTINDVMKRLGPGVRLRAENTLAGDNSELGVELKFESMKDFEPANVAKQVEPLRVLLETREKLRDLASKVDVSDELGDVLAKVLKDTEELEKFKSGLGVESADNETKGDEE